MLADRRKLLASVLAAVALLLAPAAAAGTDEAPLPRFEDTPDMADLPARWEPLLAEFGVPGLAVAVVKQGRVHAVGTFGRRDAAQELPVTPDTLFYIASITKTYMALLVCRLVEDGKLDLDTPVRDYLPRFELADEEAAAEVTVRDLLTHRAGLDSLPIESLEAYTGEITEDRFYAWLARVRPDPALTYSNLHYTLLGRVVQAVTGKSWRDALQERLLQPAGLSRTTGYASRMYGDPDHAEPLLFDGGWKRATLVKNDATMHAAGGLGTSARDAARWLQLVLDDGRLEDTQLVSAELVQLLRHEQLTYPKPRGSVRILTGRGFAWETGTYAGQAFAQHGGGYVAAVTYAALLPEERSGYFVMANTDGLAHPLCNAVGLDVLCRLTGTGIDPDPVERARQSLREMRAEPAQATPGPVAGPLPAASLAAPLAAHAGRFASPDWGTLRAQPEGEALRLFLGTAELQVLPQGAGGFRIEGPVLQQALGRFEAGADERMARLVLELPDAGTFVFSR